MNEFEIGQLKLKRKSGLSFFSGNETHPFTLTLKVPKESLPANGTQMLDLFEESMKDGSRVHELSLPLESFRP